MDNKAIGQSGEDRATEYLRSIGYKIIERNKKYPLGEIDILARDGATVVIIEVKAGRTGNFGYAIERVGPNKQHKLRQLARRLSQDYPSAVLRIDLLNVDPDSGQVIHIPNAIQSH